MSTDHEWNAGFEEGSWSDKMDSSSGAWSHSDSSGYGGGSGGSGSGSNTETIRYVVVEKEPSYSESIYPGGGMGSMHSMPNPFPDGGMGPMSHSPFSNSMLPSLGPGSNEVIDTNSMHGAVVHVPLVSPGQPKYCVRCRIISCPTSCERVDEYGCHSCPCAPSRFQTMPIMRDCSNPEPRHQPDCLATKLCVESCQEAYQLGEVGSDGCRSCKCIRRAAATTPSPEGASCPATLACMLKCTDGYVLGETDSRGCPSCKCLSKGLQQPNSNKDNNSNKNNNNEGNNKWNTDTSNSNNNNNNNNNGGKKNCKDGSSGMLASTNGIGSGKCEPPLCLSGSMSVDQAMQMGKDSAGGGVGAGGGWGGDDCGEGNMDGGSFGGSSGSGYTDMGGSSGSGYIDMGKLSGMTGSGSSGMGGSGSSGGNPFMNSMSGAGAGGAGMGGGGGGMGAMGGGGGGMGAMGGGGGGGGGGMPFSPFSSAMSGGGPGMPSGGPGGPMAGGSRTGGSAMGTASAVSATAYNKDCVGAECSAKNGMQHKDCPDLIHCLVTCDGSYKLGALGADGCQTCSCT
ncbi:uncharacterized protein LOC127878178 [Dreissena polymorpha]|nr:uncharacterized protein LOC127878178 [Dreissena polymorpha]